MNEQLILSITLVSLLALFIWGKIRYDALAVGALFVLVVLNIIPANDAFLGFVTQTTAQVDLPVPTIGKIILILKPFLN